MDREGCVPDAPQARHARVKLLVTGGAGFMGSDFVRFVLETEVASRVVVLDALTYAGSRENLADVEGDPRFRFVHGDIRSPEIVRESMTEVDAVVHFAAETHVDRSIEADHPFLDTNVGGTRTLLAVARELEVSRFLHVSTDEVYGELAWRDVEAEPTDVALARFREGEPEAPDFFTEDTPLAPRSPYAASKAAADHFVFAYHHTHGTPVIVTRSSNNHGPRQFPEKLIPLLISRGLAGAPLPIYGDGLHIRDWLHVRDHSRGVVAALLKGDVGAVYNLGGRSERTNLQVARAILAMLGLPEERIAFVSDRPGHDRRYAIDPALAERKLGWRASCSFEDGLNETVAWYRERWKA